MGPRPADDGRTTAGSSAPRAVPSIAVGEIILAHIHDAVFATDLDNRVTFWGPSAQRLFQHTAAHAVGRLFGDLLPFRMVDPADEEAFAATLRAGGTWRGSGTVRLPDGSELWIESTVEPIVTDGRVVGSVSVSRDMSTALEAQRALLAQERFVDAVLDVAGALVMVLDRNGRVVRFNHACEELSGRLYSEVVGQPALDLLVPEPEAAEVREAFARLTAGHYPATFENHWATRSGELRLVASSNTCLTDERGVVTHVIATGLDITDQRRTADALQGIEAVGRLLATDGPTDRALDAIIDNLATQMGYAYLTLVLRDGERWRLGAQRGYATIPTSFDPADGVIGRVIRTGAAAFVPNVLADPDYRPDSPDVRSEICVPLLAGGETLGVLDIEATGEAPVTDRDLRLSQAVADRLASALVLGREQLALRERARIFAALTAVGTTVNAIQDADQLWPALVEGIRAVVPGDVVTLTVLDRASGEYVVRAVDGMSATAVGSVIKPGEGVTGRAITAREIVAIDTLRHDQFSALTRDRVAADSLAVMAAPLLREGSVLGAIVVGRADGAAFTALEREVVSLLASNAALAVANVHLLEEVSALAIHDPLTGLYNRRHFDAALDLIVARWRRAKGKRPVTAVMFDLDHFGDFNRAHGHQAGDEALRVFAAVLTARIRASDLVARYGGEEFVAILEDCPLGQAMELAESVRATFEGRVIESPANGSADTPLRSTVSAGCALLDAADPTKQALIRAADVGLIMAKRGGRNQVVAV